MEKIIITIGASKDHFGAYAENCPGIYGGGNTVQEAKENALEGMRLFIKTRSKSELPEILKGEYKIEYNFDIPSFLAYYSGIFTKSALERITGINQKQLFHYASGIRKPSEKTIQKMDKALHKFTEELSQIRLT